MNHATDDYHDESWPQIGPAQVRRHRAAVDGDDPPASPDREQDAVVIDLPIARAR